ncbi:MAG: adenylyltransferase/cytidyltransferase family protein [Proteobacteria bacterium]|nr:adenylyltransferase/cytidyltransferase family protein [Pseudomonadota bacterium]
MAAIGSDGKTTPLPGFADKVGRYVRSTSTRTAAFVGLLTYLSYAYAHGSWANPALIGVSLFTGLFLPTYAKLSNKAELWAQNRFGFVTAGRLGRFVPQYGFNLAVFWVLLWGGALNRVGMASVGGFAGAALVTSLASQGSQYLGLYLFQRGYGDANRNVLAGVSINLVLAAFGTAGVPFAREAFLVLGLLLGAVLFGIGLLSDLRSVFAPKGGIGIFFGTFNPFHNTHLDMIRRAIEQRGLEKVIVHPTLIPRIHVEAFRKGQIRIARLEDGFQIYEKTEKADVNVDYFPSGRQFLPPETRKVLIDLSVAEVGLADKVEVAFYPEIYNSKGFQGVIAEVKRRYPGKRLHGLHGTDIGGMTVRGIYDECGWIYPWRILRRDKISATAIRRGAKGMTSGIVTDVLAQLTQNLPEVTAGGRRFRNDNGVLTEGV